MAIGIGIGIGIGRESIAGNITPYHHQYHHTTTTPTPPKSVYKYKQSAYSPNQILILPTRPDAGYLEDKNPIVVEEVVHLAEEESVAADTDVL